MLKSLLIRFFLLSTILHGGQIFLQDTLQYSKPSGWYSDSSNFILKIKGNGILYYTTNGTIPSSSTSSKYPQNGLLINKTTVLRLALYSGGNRKLLESKSYIIGRNHKLPIVSIITDSDNFWDESKGIYVKGCCAESEPPYRGANFWKDWERPIHVEFYDTNNHLGFAQNAGIKIFGGFSVGLPQKSLAIFARRKYGDNKFRYPIFHNQKHIKKYKNFVLRNSGSDFSNTHFRDALMTSLVKGYGVDVQASRPAVVYVNGEYFGIYNIREKINEHFIANHYPKIDKEQLQILRHRYEHQHGSTARYKHMLKFIEKNHFYDSTPNPKWLSDWIDIPNYIKHNIYQTYFWNKDAGGNIRYFRPTNIKGAKWKWILFDTDFGMGMDSKTGYKHNTIDYFTKVNNEAWPAPPWSTLIIRRILESDSLKQWYLSYFAEALNVNFNTPRVLHYIDSLQGLIQHEMPYHLEKWGRDSNINKWQDRVEKLRVFAKKRPTYIWKYLMEKYDIKDTISITFHPPPNEEQGSLLVNDRKITKTERWAFFEGMPLKISYRPNISYSHVGTKDTIIYPFRDTVIKTNFQEKGEGKYFKKVLFNEVCFSSDKSNEWIEFYNKSDKRIDMSGWVFQKNIHSYFVFDSNTFIEPNGHLIIVKNIEDFDDVYETKISGDFDFSIDDEGTKYSLFDKEYFLIDDFFFIPPKKKFYDNKEDKIVQLQLDGDYSKWIDGSDNASPGKMNQALVEVIENYKTIGVLKYFGFLFLGIVIILLLWYFIFEKN